MEASRGHPGRWILLAIFLMGFFLRTYQLSEDSFWNDEAGQVLAAMQPSSKSLLEMSRTHAMAMPLDYLVSYYASRLGVNEYVMRFPSVIWSSLTLAVLYSLSARLTNRDVATWTTILLAFSDRHVYYAQEVRFYASLGFFTCLSFYVQHKALLTSTFKSWVTVGIVILIGMYFHPYVLLTLSFGVCATIFYIAGKKTHARSFMLFVITSLVLILIFIPGYVFFGSKQQFSYKLSEFSSQFYVALLRGLGWYSWPHTDNDPAFTGWEYFCLFTAVTGVFSAIKRKLTRKVVLVALLSGTLMQIAAIILADILKAYFFAARQIIHLIPVLFIFSAIGTRQLILLLSQRLSKSRNLPKRLMSIAVFGLILCITLPRLQDYYHYVKGDGKSITQVLVDKYQESSPVYVDPPYEIRIYTLYLRLPGFDRPDIIDYLRPMPLTDLMDSATHDKTPQFLIARSILEENETAQIARAGFIILYDAGIRGRHVRSVYIRD